MPRPPADRRSGPSAPPGVRWATQASYYHNPTEISSENDADSHRSWPRGLQNPSAAEWPGPAVPDLHLRFEDAGEVAPCAGLPMTPSETAVECWSAYVDRSASKRSSSLTAESELACVRG